MHFYLPTGELNWILEQEGKARMDFGENARFAVGIVIAGYMTVESRHERAHEAAARVNYLNGGTGAQLEEM